MAKAVVAVTTAAADAGPPPYIIHEDTVWSPMKAGGFRGYVIAKDMIVHKGRIFVPLVDGPDVSDLPKQPPWIAWEGGRMPLSLWHTVMAFFEWSQAEFKAEAQVRLYYNATTHKWGVWAYPQRPNGMTTNELPDNPGYAEQRRQFPDPWVNLGTIHHHCTSGAFQSHTDQNNEETQTGLHITVGKIGSGEYDLHNRVILRSTQFTGHSWLQWFDLPEAVASALPAKLHSTILQSLLKEPPPEGTVFPETWKTNCVRYTSNSSTTTYPHAGSASSVKDNRQWSPIDTNLRAQFKENEIDFMAKNLALIKERNITHTELDVAVNMTAEAQHDDISRALATEVMGIAVTHSVSQERVDELFDKWDFEVVLGELNKTASAVTK